MALAVYPSTLPYHQLADGFQRSEHHRDIVVTETEDGPGRRRIQSKTRVKKFVSNIKYTAEQYAVWEAFAEETLSQATQKFIMPVPYNGNSYVNKIVQIENGRWSDRPSGLDWIVTMALEVFPGDPE